MLIKTPKGDAFDSKRVGGVAVVPTKGVKVEDHSSNLLSWIDTDRDEDAIRIRDELIRAIEGAERGRKYQPDWTFLSQVAVLRPTKVG